MYFMSHIVDAIIKIMGFMEEELHVRARELGDSCFVYGSRAPTWAGLSRQFLI